jgi:hypothetical protein
MDHDYYDDPSQDALVYQGTHGCDLEILGSSKLESYLQGPTASHFFCHLFNSSLQHSIIKSKKTEATKRVPQP